MSIIALFVVLLFSVSANTHRVYQAVEGFKAPQMVLRSGSDNLVSLSDFRGRYVLVNFWTSADANSRIAANSYDRFVESMPEEERICLLSVNMDRSERLFREIVRRDKLNAKSQFFVNAQQASDLVSLFNLSNGVQSLLIDPQGVIVATNPDISAIARVLGA